MTAFTILRVLIKEFINIVWRRSENKKEGYGFNRIRMSLSICFKIK